MLGSPPHSFLEIYDSLEGIFKKEQEKGSVAAEPAALRKCLWQRIPIPVVPGEDKGAKTSPLALPGCVSVVAITMALILPQELTPEIAHSQDGAEVGLKGQLGTGAGSCTFKKAETRGGGREALT